MKSQRLDTIRGRREAVDSVLGTMAAAGDTLSPESLQDFECYVQGEIDLDELTRKSMDRALRKPSLT